jgi:hypothetical protein
VQVYRPAGTFARSSSNQFMTMTMDGRAEESPACLTIRKVSVLRVGRRCRRQDLDGDDAIEARIAGPVDFSHPSGAQRG